MVETEFGWPRLWGELWNDSGRRKGKFGEKVSCLGIGRDRRKFGFRNLAPLASVLCNTKVVDFDKCENASKVLFGVCGGWC